MSERILSALRQLDPQNPNHWTGDGLPRLDTLKFLTKDAALTREAVTAAAPGFSRASMVLTDSAPATAAQTAAPQGSASPGPQAAPAAVQGASRGADYGDEESAGTGEHSDAKDDAVAQVTQVEETPLQVAQREYAAAAEVKARADKAAAEARAALDRAIEASEATRGTTPHAEVVRGYLDRQAKILAERGARVEALKGVNLKDILPTRAKIDEALARKSGRGLQRPRGV